MTTTLTEPVGLLRALDACSVEDAIAQLDGLLRLADNAADELGLLCEYRRVPLPWGRRHVRPRGPRRRGRRGRAAGAASQAEPVKPAGGAQRVRAIGAPRVALVPVAHRRPGRAAMPGRGVCLDLAYITLLLLGAAGTYAELWRALP